MHLTGEPDGPPSRLGAPSIIDQTTGLDRRLGLLAAIIQARSTGKGATWTRAFSMLHCISWDM